MALYLRWRRGQTRPRRPPRRQQTDIRVGNRAAEEKDRPTVLLPVLLERNLRGGGLRPVSEFLARPRPGAAPSGSRYGRNIASPWAEDVGGGLTMKAPTGRVNAVVDSEAYV